MEVNIRAVAERERPSVPPVHRARYQAMEGRQADQQGP